MNHAASSTTGVLRRVALPVSAAGLLVASTLGLSMASANAIGDGGPNENCATGQIQITFEGNQISNGSTMNNEGFTVTLSDVQRGETGDSDSPTVTMGSDIKSFDFLASAGLVNVLVKGGTEVNRVIGTENPDGTFSGNDITAAVNPRSDKPFGVSNVKFCFAAAPVAPASPTATITVSPSPSTSMSPSASPTANMSMSPSPSTSASPSARTTTIVSMSPSPSTSPSTGGTGTTGGTGSGGGTGTIGGGSGGGAGSPTTDDGTSGNGGGTAAGGPATGGGFGQPTSGQPSALPFTGLVLDGLVVVALWAFGIGLLLMALGRRRSSLVS